MLGRDFRKLWIGQSISFFGSQITSVALPLTAVAVLQANERQMGWLTAAETLPMAVFGLLAGVWMDRMRRRPVLVAMDVARGVLLASIPIAAMAGVLTFAQLLVVAFGAGSCYVVAAVADRAYLPSLLRPEQLVAGNARLQGSYSAARTVGPGLAGLLIAKISAPFTIALDAISFFVAGGVVASIRHEEPQPEGTGRTLAGMREGLLRVARHPQLRPLVLCGGLHNICSTMMVALYFLHLKRNLDIEEEGIGLIVATGGVGALLGSVYAPRVAGRLGDGRALIVAQALTGVARLLVPLAGGPFLLAVSECLLGAVRALFNITQISLRQRVIDPNWQGRVNASIGFLLWAFTPLGALAGGYLASAIGTRNTLWIAATGVMAATLLALPLSRAAPPSSDRTPTARP
ncbi:MAG: MFS transporter [Planctomycetota bacterium]